MRSLVLAAALAATSGAAAQSAHQHGIADLFVVVEKALPSPWN
jgi:hypothetical protein